MFAIQVQKPNPDSHPREPYTTRKREKNSSNTYTHCNQHDHPSYRGFLIHCSLKKQEGKENDGKAISMYKAEGANRPSTRSSNQHSGTHLRSQPRNKANTYLKYY